MAGFAARQFALVAAQEQLHRGQLRERRLEPLSPADDFPRGRIRAMRTPGLIALASILVVAAAPAAALDVVYVTRHAQKNPSPQWDTINAFRPLSPKGARCAGRLGKLLENRGVAAVYTSEVARTLATGAAVSTTRDGVEIIGDDATLKPTAEFVQELRERHRDDQAILIVGHSNTVDDVVLAFRPSLKECLDRLRLTNPDIGTRGVPETQYGDVWRLSLDKTECHGAFRERLGRVGEDDCSVP